MVECCVCRVTDTALQKLLTHCGALMDAKHYRKLHESLLPVVVAMQTAMTPPYTGAAFSLSAQNVDVRLMID